MRPLLSIAGALLVVAYPFAVYYGLTRWDARRAGLLLIGCVVAMALLRVTRDRAAHWRAVLRVPATVCLALGAGVAIDTPAFMLALPVLTNLALLYQFAASLRGPVPLVEHFARLTEPELSPEEVSYCRRVTIVWSAFFVANAAVSAALAALAPVSWWAVYTGALAYVAMGSLFTVEYLFRKYRFRKFGRGLHDRLLERILSRSGSVGRAEP